jgi:glucan phosphoethanolaminetransferase (alkaline phosphatase superfamily)
MEEVVVNDKELISESTAKEDKYFIVSTGKLATLYILTLGLYAVYWFYKNWKLQQPLMKEKITPPLRSLFYIFFTHSLFRRISDSLASKNIGLKFNAGLMANLFVVLTLVSNIAGRLADKPSFPAYLNLVWLLALFLSVYPLQEAQDAINQLSGDPLGKQNAKYDWKNIVTIVICGLLWILLLVGLAVKVNTI